MLVDCLRQLSSLCECYRCILFGWLQVLCEQTNTWREAINKTLINIIISFFPPQCQVNSSQVKSGLLSFLSSSLIIKPIQGFVAAFQSLSPHALVMLKAFFLHVMTECRVTLTKCWSSAEYRLQHWAARRRFQSHYSKVSSSLSAGLKIKKKIPANVCDAKWAPQKAHRRLKTSKRSDVLG